MRLRARQFDEPVGSPGKLHFPISAEDLIFDLSIMGGPMRNLIFAILAGLSACDGGKLKTTVDQAPPPQFIEAGRDGTIQTTNRLRFEIAYPGSRLAGPIHRREVFNDHPFEISLAALIGDEGAVIVHAERVADASGASDYGALPLSSWPSTAFRKGAASCVDIGPDDIAGEHDLEWLAANRFDPAGSALIQQYFSTTNDHNDEVVLTLMRKIASCADAGEPEAELDPLRIKVSVAAVI